MPPATRRHAEDSYEISSVAIPRDITEEARGTATSSGRNGIVLGCGHVLRSARRRPRYGKAQRRPPRSSDAERWARAGPQEEALPHGSHRRGLSLAMPSARLVTGPSVATASRGLGRGPGVATPIAWWPHKWPAAYLRQVERRSRLATPSGGLRRRLSVPTASGSLGRDLCITTPS